MKLLLTGVLPGSVWVIAHRLVRGGHEVTVLGAAEEPKERIPGVRFMRMGLQKKETARYITACGFDSVLFFFACQCEDQRTYGSVQGSQLDVMFDILHGFAHTSVRQFILITDQRVFGAGQDPGEDVIPLPDTPTGIMIKAAESCVSCGVTENIGILIVRTTSLYVPGDPASFFSQARAAGQSRQQWLLDGTADTPCDFLHAEDFGVLLEHAVSLELTGVLHAAQGAPSSYGQTIDMMNAYLPDLDIAFLGKRNRRSTLHGSRAFALGGCRVMISGRNWSSCARQTDGKRAKRVAASVRPWGRRPGWLSNGPKWRCWPCWPSG